MKTLTVAVPCYNSQDYMRHAIEPLLICENDIEILIIDDGSKDKTGEIGDLLEEEYPATIRCIHQENGGHGREFDSWLQFITNQIAQNVDYINAFEFFYCQIFEIICSNT